MAGSEIGSATFGLVVGMGRFKRQLEEAEQDAKASGNKVGNNFTDEATDEVSKGSARWSSALDSLKPAMLAGGAALGAAAVMGLMNGLEQEAAGDKLAAQLNLDPAEAETAARIAGDVYAGAWGESLGEVHDAVGAVMSSLGDLDPAGVEAATIKALDLASAFDVDVSRAVSSAGILMRSGLAADSEEAFDLITRGMQQMPAHLREELLEASDEYAQFFGQLGIDGPAAFGMLTEAAQDGMYGIDKTGDAIKELTIRSTDMSATSVAAYDAMGLSADDMAAKILAGGDTAREGFDQIIDGLLGIEDPTAQANAAIALFGTPLEDLATADIPDFLAGLDSMTTTLGDVEGAADDLGETLNDNASTEIEAFKRQALQGLGDFAVKYAIPAIKDLAGFINDKLLPAVRGIADWATQNKGVLIAVSTVIGGMLVAAFTSWAVAAGIAAAATLAAMAPVLLLGAAVGALVYLVVTHWDTITSVIGAGLDFITGAISGAIDWVRSNWPLLLGILTGPIGLAVVAITRNWDTIKSGITSAKNWIVDRFNDVVNTITGLPGRITSAASSMWDGIKNSFRGTINWIITKWNNLRLGFEWDAKKIAGVTVFPAGSAYLNTPNLPLLGSGGTATYPGLALVGERGPELLHMPIGASVIPLDHGALSPITGGDGGTEVIRLEVDGKVLAAVVRDHDHDYNRRNGRAA